MQHSEAVLLLRKTTTNFHVYTSADNGMTVYVKRDRLTRTPPDVLIGSVRTPAPGDAASP